MDPTKRTGNINLIQHILLPKDYVRYRLTESLAMDKADGSGTLLFDIKQREWSSEILSTLDIPSTWLHHTFEGPEITGVISASAATQTGLVAGTPVVAGGGDQSAQAVGVGAVQPGIVAITLGTSGVVFTTNDEPRVEPQGRLHAFCHAVPNKWHFMGVMLSAAGSLNWYRDTFTPNVSYENLLMEAETVPSGCGGLLFLPYLSGERTPYPDPMARGSWVGLSLMHQRGHITRSVLEGVGFGFKDYFNLIQQTGVKNITQVHISGGGARSSLWQHILADVLNTELVTVNTTEGAAYDAALLAGVGANAWDNVLETCDSVIKVVEKTSPNIDQIESFEYWYSCYRDLYPTLKTIFQRIGRGLK